MFFKTAINYLFLFILSYFCEGGCSSQVYAASIAATEKQNIVINRSKNDQLTNNHLNSSQLINNTIYTSINLIQPSDFTYSPKTSDSHAMSGSARPLLYKSLYNQGKIFFIKNNDNEVLQNSIIFLSQSKQFIKETDIMLHDLSENILTSLNIVTANNKDLLSQQETQYLTTFNNKDSRYRTNAPRSQHFYSKNNYSNQTLYKLIFNKQNFYYLFTLVVFIYITKRIVNVMFLKKQYDIQNRR